METIFSSSFLGATLSGLFEGLGVPWPGLLVLTAAAANHKGGNGVQGALLLGTLFTITYLVGALAQYALGRWCRDLIERWLPESIRSRMDGLISKYGQWAVLWTRPVGLGNYISIPAGMIRMNPIRFILYTLLGIWPWAFAVSLLGEIVSHYLAEALPYVVAALLVAAAVTVARKLWLTVRHSQRGF